MVACATVMKSLLLAAILVALTGHGSAVEKLSDCCTSVNREEISETILGFLSQPKVGRCVRAVMRNRARSTSVPKLTSSSPPSSASSSSSSSS
ncbi:hypothetical protein CRUP_010682 [Coryphaenoides rupestris]|nr:hypothetical protein CRUP_010682 [Coryphaenoides rupestris]